MAANHGVAVKTLRRWRLLYQSRGLPRGQAHTCALCPVCDGADLDAGAYAELLGWYLGDGHLTRARRDVFTLRIVNDVRYPRLNARIVELLTRVKPGARAHVRDRTGCVLTAVGWKHWPCLFPQHGPGRKHERRLELEAWQREAVSSHPHAFLRGLLHSDGCRITNWTTRNGKRYEYGRWFFSNESVDIMGWCQEALDLVGVSWTMPRPNCLSVATRAGVAHLDEHVGPKI